MLEGLICALMRPCLINHQLMGAISMPPMNAPVTQKRGIPPYMPKEKAPITVRAYM